jgi:protein tyrosine phosphatase (PTP) superfamily phosphohydrolase (DUF442 family)
MIAVLTTLILTALAALWVFRRPLCADNLGVVEPHRVYRIAQPQPDDWKRLLDEIRPASVLNLRGGWMGNPWYAAEINLGRQGIDVYDFPMLATERPDRDELLTLVDLFDRCRYPLLIHCKSGADRTGLASGLYLMYKRGVPPERAREALTLAHGHIPLFGPERMHAPFREYAAWLKARRLSHTPERLRGWIVSHYHDDNPASSYEILLPGPRPQSGDPIAARDARPHTPAIPRVMGVRE